MSATSSKRRNTGGREGGFSLVEVMIAIAIFSIGFLAVGTMQITAVNKNARSRNWTALVTVAKDRAEQLMALPYDHPDLIGPLGDAADNDLDGLTDEADEAGPAWSTQHQPAQGADGIDNDEDGVIDEPGESGHLTVTWLVSDGTPLAGAKTVRVVATRSAGRTMTSTIDFIKGDGIGL